MDSGNCDLEHPLLVDSMEMTNETEEIGESLLQQLRIQGEQLQSAANTTINMRNITRSSKQFLNKIGWRICKEKLILFFVILLLAVIDVLLFYRLVTNHGHIF